MRTPLFVLVPLFFCAVVLSVAGCGDGTAGSTAGSALTASTAMATTAPPQTTTTAATEAQPTTTAAPETTTTFAPEPQGAWTALAPGGAVPAARAGHSLVYDETSSKVILFGGWAGADFNDTWAYDPVAGTWTDLAPTGDLPPARHDHVMTLDTDTGLVILFGGIDAKTYEEFADTWAYDPAANTWTELAPSGDLPQSRCLHAMVYDPATKKVILFGGSRHGGCLGDTWAYDPAANTWTELSPTGDLPLARYGAVMVYDPGLAQSLLFGGSDGHLMGDTWAYDSAADAWKLLMAVDSSAARPAAREFYSMAYDQGAQRTVLFGGCGVDPLGDTWAYDSATNTWTDLAPAGDGPSPRTYSPLAYCAATGTFVIFGGSEAVAASSPVGDTWSYDPAP